MMNDRLARPDDLRDWRGAPWRDQVPRREEFEAAHPEVAITPPGPVTGIRWKAELPDGECIRQFHLCDLLDMLEELFTPP